MNKIIYIDNLKEEQKQRYESKGIEVLTPLEVLTKTIVDTDDLVVLCELNIDKDGNKINRTDFYGVKFVQELRRNKFMGKVLFISFIGREHLTIDKPFNRIINTIGHSYLQLPHNPNDWGSHFEIFNKLDLVEWYDIDSNYCIKEGLAQQELHQLHGLINDKSFTNEFVIEQIKNCVLQIGLLYNTETTDFIEGLSFLDISKAITDADTYCVGIINDNKATISEIATIEIKKPWSILFLDDEIDSGHNLILELEKQVENVYCVNNVIDAENILNRNVKEGLRIFLIVSDYRLFKTDFPIKIHQPKQGYKFLMETSAGYPYLGLVAFSSLSRKFLLQSFKRMGIRVDVYSKKDYFVSDTTLKILVDELVDKGNEAFDAITRLPRLSSPHWKNFEVFYTYHRRSIDYLANEQYISSKAKSYCINHQQGNTFFDLTDYTTELKGKSKTPDKPKFFKEFLEKMICRRAILWYSRMFSKEPINSPKDIIEFLQGMNYNSEMSENTPTNQINTNLALRLTEFPWNTTIEEKEWLINQMGEDRSKIEDVENKEIEILNFAEKEIVKLKTEQKCQPNTFVNCKMWLTDALNNLYKNQNGKELVNIAVKINNKLLNIINQIDTSPTLIQILQDKKLVQDSHYKSILFQYKSLIDFYNYLLRLKKYANYFNNSPVSGGEILNIEEIKSYILKAATKEFARDYELKSGIDSSILMFFAELKEVNKTFQGNKEYYTNFVEFHKNNSFSFNPFRDTSIDKHSFHLSSEDDLGSWN